MQEHTPHWRRTRRNRWQRWAEGIDPWHPRPADYLLFAVAFLVVSLAWVGARTAAVQLNRRLFALEERAVALREANAALAARATALADRTQVGERARRELGMVVPKPGDFRTIAYVRSAGPAAGPAPLSATMHAAR
jgi:cell division protein FtsB